MPNWCYNRLQIEGKTEDVLNFINEGIKTASAQVTSFDTPKEKQEYYKELSSIDELNEKTAFPNLSAWLPLPMEYITEENPDWFSWCCGHWGCKWDSAPHDIAVSTLNGWTIVTLEYDTAWCGNTEWVRNVGAKYPEIQLILDSYEPGCDWGTGCLCEGGIYMECEVDSEWKEFWSFNDDEVCED